MNLTMIGSNRVLSVQKFSKAQKSEVSRFRDGIDLYESET